MSRAVRITGLCLAVLTMAVHAVAQTPSRAGRRPDAWATFAASGHVGLGLFTAADSFKAVLGSRAGTVFGGGAEARFRSGLFAGVRVSRFEQSGTRVFDLGIPATVAITPIEAVAGYRLARNGRAVPYVGGGVGWHRYDEASDFAASGENVSEVFTGYHALGGVEWRASRLIGVAGEAQWTTVPDALGRNPRSASAAFDEQDLGGLGFRVRVIIGH